MFEIIVQVNSYSLRAKKNPKLEVKECGVGLWGKVDFINLCMYMILDVHVTIQ